MLPIQQELLEEVKKHKLLINNFRKDGFTNKIDRTLYETKPDSEYFLQWRSQQGFLQN